MTSRAYRCHRTRASPQCRCERTACVWYRTRAEIHAGSRHGTPVRASWHTVPGSVPVPARVCTLSAVHAPARPPALETLHHPRRVADPMYLSSWRLRRQCPLLGLLQTLLDSHLHELHTAAWGATWLEACSQQAARAPGRGFLSDRACCSLEVVVLDGPRDPPLQLLPKP